MATSQVQARWSIEKNSRRLELIDKAVHQAVTSAETAELASLTEQLRLCCDTEDAVPIDGVTQLKNRLCDPPMPLKTSKDN